MRFLRRFGKMLADPTTWTSMIYMILKLPLGILNSVVALTLPIVSAGLTLLPLIYVVNLLIDLILIKSGVPISDSGSILIPNFIEVHGSFDLVMFVRSLVGVPIGLVLWFITRYLLNVLALISGELARALLGPGAVALSALPPQSYAPPMVMQEQRTYTE